MGGSFPITHSQLGHKVAATLVLVRGSICLILETEAKWECSFNLRNKTPDLAWVMFTWAETGTHPTCCPPTPDMLRVGCCSLLPHWQTGCTRTLRCPERRQSNTWLLQLKSDTLSNRTVSGYLLGPYRRANIWEYCSAPCCHITHLQQRQRETAN